MATLSHTSTDTRSTALLWKGAGLTAFAAVLFPRVNAVIYDDEKFWQLDHEAAVLAPIVVVVSMLTFAVVGTLTWRSTERLATTSLACGIVSIVGVLGFWISAPIILGGLAATLGIEGLDRPGQQRRRAARVGVVLGVFATVVGAVMWLAGV